MQEPVLIIKFSGNNQPRTGVSIQKRDGHYFVTNTRNGEEYESKMSKELLVEMLIGHFAIYSPDGTDTIQFFCGPFTTEVNRCCSFPKSDVAPVVARFVQYLDSL